MILISDAALILHKADSSTSIEYRHIKIYQQLYYSIDDFNAKIKVLVLQER